MSVTALIPSAGSGNRMSNGRDDKPFLELKGKPLLSYVLSVLERSELIDSIIVIAKEKYVAEAKKVVENCGAGKVADVIPGGETRTQSVRNGLANIKADDDDIVLIHDGVRPFLTEGAISATVEAAREHGASVLGVPCTSTIKKVTGEDVIDETVDRTVLWEAQTPQAFRYGMIKKAYGSFEDADATDDSSFVERLGIKVRVVPGDRNNIKVTVPEDLMLAEAILETKKCE
jgi:2-C-methyl-D-erythritol 4-phosphate cytidylyltransferase